MIIISESGPYTLTIRSRKPSARQGHNGRAPNRTQIMGHVSDEWKGSAQVATLSLIAVITMDVPSLPRNFAPGYPRSFFWPGPTRIFRALTG